MGDDKVIIPGYIMVTHWFIILTLLLTIVALAIRAYDRNEKIKWAKNNLRVLALLSILSPPLFFVSFLNISYKRLPYGDGEARLNLHNMYLDCKAYWADNGSDQDCNITILNQPGIELFSEDVYIEGHGTEATFIATAQHKRSPNVYTINGKGQIAGHEPINLVERPVLSLFR